MVVSSREVAATTDKKEVFVPEGAGLKSCSSPSVTIKWSVLPVQGGLSEKSPSVKVS